MNFDKLTKREREIVAHLLEGERVKLIAKRLLISEATIRFHLRNIFSKLDVHSQAELVEKVDAVPGLAEGLRNRDAEATEAAIRRDCIRAVERLARIVRATTTEEQSIKDAVRMVLPFSAPRRVDWTRFFRRWALDLDTGSPHDSRRTNDLELFQLSVEIVKRYQASGIVRSDADPTEVVEKLYALTVQAAWHVLFSDTPETRESQLSIVDAYVDSLIANDEPI